MPSTIPRFSSHAALRSASEAKVPLRQGAKREGVAILQQALIDLGSDVPNSTHRGTKGKWGIGEIRMGDGGWECGD